MSWRESIKKITSKISGRYKYVSGKKGKIEKQYQQLKQWRPNSAPGEIARIVGLTGVDLSWFLFCLGKYTAKDLNTVFLDNKIIDKFKNKNINIKRQDADSKFQAFFKNLQQSYPKTAARLKLWMLYVLFAGMTVGSVKIVQNNNRDDIEQENKDIDQQENKQITFGEFQEKMQPITPWLIAELIAAEGVKLDENGLHKPYQDGNGIWTIGYGSTCLKDGRPVTPNTPHITNEEAYELARWHLEERETFFDLFCYGAFDDSLLPRNTGEAFGLSSIVYNSATKFIENEKDKNHRNRFEVLRKEYKMRGNDINDSIVKDAFDRYPIVDKAAFGRAWMDSGESIDMANAIGLYMKDGRGMHWRRWLEAGLITGDIDPVDLLECPIGGLYDFYLYMGGWQKNKTAAKYSLWEQGENGLTPKKSTYDDFKQWLENPISKHYGTGKESSPVRAKVKDFLPPDVLQQCMQGKCEIGDFSKDTQTKTIAFNRGINKIKNMKKKDKSLVSQDININNRNI